MLHRISPVNLADHPSDSSPISHDCTPECPMAGLNGKSLGLGLRNPSRKVKVVRALQIERIVSGCYQTGLDSDGKEYNCCPDKESECEILKDCVQFGINLNVLPCQGALLPDEADPEKEDEVRQALTAFVQAQGLELVDTGQGAKHEWESVADAANNLLTEAETDG